MPAARRESYRAAETDGSSPGHATTRARVGPDRAGHSAPKKAAAAHTVVLARGGGCAGALYDYRPASWPSWTHALDTTDRVRPGRRRVGRGPQRAVAGRAALSEGDQQPPAICQRREGRPRSANRRDAGEKPDRD